MVTLVALGTATCVDERLSPASALALTEEAFGAVAAAVVCNRAAVALGIGEVMVRHRFTVAGQGAHLSFRRLVENLYRLTGDLALRVLKAGLPSDRQPARPAALC